MEKLPKKVETPKREETKPLQNQAKLTHTEQEKVFTTTIKKNKTQPVKTEINVRLEAFNLITKYEGFHEKPYWDAVRYAYGYGQPAPHKNATITREESELFVYNKIDSYIKQHKLQDLPPKIQVSLLSFRYNTGKMPEGYRWYIKNNHYKALANLMRKYVYSNGKKLAGLEKRRTEETNYFLN